MQQHVLHLLPAIVAIYRDNNMRPIGLFDFELDKMAVSYVCADYLQGGGGSQLASYQGTCHLGYKAVSVGMIMKLIDLLYIISGDFL